MHVRKTAAALLALMASSSALAEHPIIVTEAVESKVVSFADLDLTTNAGVNALYGRLTAAAYLVCDVDVGVDFTRQIRARHCYQSAMTDASDQLGRAVANALERRSGLPFASGGR